MPYRYALSLFVTISFISCAEASQKDDGSYSFEEANKIMRSCGFYKDAQTQTEEEIDYKGLFYGIQPNFLKSLDNSLLLSRHNEMSFSLCPNPQK